MKAATFNILCLSGSLRKNSCNSGVLRYILSLAPSFPNAKFDFHSLFDLPMYNGDLDPTENRTKTPAIAWPVPAKILRDKFENADLLIFGLSENNGNVSPVLINAIAWGSRPENVQRNGKEVTIQPIAGKKLGVISTGGKLGGNLAQEKLRGMFYLKFEFIDLPSGPICLQAYAPGNFEENGDLANTEVKGKVKAYLEYLVNEASKKK